VSSSLDERHERAVQAVRRASTLPDLLRTAARQFVEVADGEACAISRVVGDVLIEVFEYAVEDRTLVLGHGYLISDFPLTKEALEEDKPRTASVLDPRTDESEANLLRELKFDSLLMVPLACEGSPWGLVEIYVNGREFTPDEVMRAHDLASTVCARIEQLPVPGSS
jgi:GAF domain-containing protein